MGLLTAAALFKSIPSPLENPIINMSVYPDAERQANNHRPGGLLTRLNTSVRFGDTESEGRPSIYLFIFVNPLSGDCKGKDLLTLPIQHFRLRRFPKVQVEIHNILDEKDRDLGLETIKLVETMAKFNKLPPLNDTDDQDNDATYKIGATVRTRHIHVWSCGGDGTVMSLFELLVERRVDLDYMFFSCRFISYFKSFVFFYLTYPYFRYSFWYRKRL